MIFKHTRLVSMLAVVVLLTLPIFVSAQSGLPKQIVPESCNQDGGCKSICDIALLAQNVLNTGIFIAIVLSAILFAWAGWKLLTSGGNTEVYAQGKRIFGNVLVGLLIILVGWIVIDTLMRMFLGANPSLPWNRICMELISHFEHFYA